jgi:hypothetical protein
MNEVDAKRMPTPQIPNENAFAALVEEGSPLRPSNSPQTSSGYVHDAS